MILLISIVALALATVACWAATWLTLQALRWAKVFDLPNERSSHIIPTARGGGLALVSVLIASCIIISASTDLKVISMEILFGGLILAIVSFADDLKSLPIFIRLIAQIGAVILGVSSMPTEHQVFQGLLPPFWDAFGTGLIWLWFINLYNFMDGIDGIATVETLSISLGLTLLGLSVNSLSNLAITGAVIAGSSIGFLFWNWHPAKIFMGDVGSISIGFFVGFLLLWLAGQGHWVAAVILPLYFLLDSGLTLCRRLLRRDIIWHPHRTHFYQTGVTNGLGHDKVCFALLLLNIVLVGTALYATLTATSSFPLIIATSTSMLLIWYLGTYRDKSKNVR